MKKIITTQSVKCILFILFLCSVLLYSHEDVIACNSPYTQRIAHMNYNYNGRDCQYWIVYCCWWNSSQNKLNVYFKEVWHLSVCRIFRNDWDHFRNAMMTAMYNDAVKKCGANLPPCDPLPPQTIRVIIPHCYYYENALVEKYPGDEPIWMLKLIDCGTSGKCERRKIDCIDYSKNPPEIVTLLDECEVLQQPFCGFDEPTIPPQGKSFEEAWLTDCFARPCCP